LDFTRPIGLKTTFGHRQGAVTFFKILKIKAKTWIDVLIMAIYCSKNS
jgi:hypothetical protein